MVLDNASTDPPSGDSYGDSFPSSEPPFEDRNISDSYEASSSDSARVPIGPGVYLNLKDLPRPVTLFMLESRHASILITSIREGVKVIANTTQRPTRQEEVDALAYHTARGIRLASYGTPIGTGLGIALAVRGNSTFRFPFYSPMKEGGRFSPDRFPLFTGLQARLMWHMLRYGAYGLLGGLMGSIFFGSYGLTVSMQGRVVDPRLKDFMDTLRKTRVSGNSLKEILEQRNDAPGARPRDNETFEMARQRTGVQDVWKQSQQQARTPERRVDDASPTGGMFNEEFMSAPAATTEQLNSKPKRNQQSDNVWEKLRQDASSQRPTGTGSSSQRSTSPKSDSFDFSSSGRDFQTARNEEQKQFDARLQREREGKDFEDRGGGS